MRNISPLLVSNINSEKGEICFLAILNVKSKFQINLLCNSIIK